MKKQIECLQLLTCLILLNACGTRDYDVPQTESAVQKEEVIVPSARLAGGAIAIVPREEPSPGYLWGGLEWIGIPTSMVSKLKCKLADDESANELKALGAAMVGGAAVGIVIKYSGSWFFGKPADSGPGHWFWNRLDETTKNVTQGALRGVVFGGVCQTALAGGNFTPFAGILGQSFAALASAITLGVLSSIAATPLIQKLMGPSSSSVSEAVLSSDATEKPVHGRLRRVTATIKEWSEKSTIGKGLRYRVAPGLAIVGIGAGVGLLVYDGLQSEDLQRTVRCDD
jgi:hypothetical protein